MEDEYGGAMRVKKKSPLRPFLPVIGFFMIVILGAVSWFLSPTMMNLASGLVDTANIELIEIPVLGLINPLRLIFTLVTFVVLVGIVVILFSVLVPKSREEKEKKTKYSLSTEKQLKKEKEEKQKELLAKKKRQREIQKKMFEENKRRMEEAAKKK